MFCLCSTRLKRIDSILLVVLKLFIYINIICKQLFVTDIHLNDELFYGNSIVIIFSTFRIFGYIYSDVFARRVKGRVQRTDYGYGIFWKIGSASYSDRMQLRSVYAMQHTPKRFMKMNIENHNSIDRVCSLQYSKQQAKLAGVSWNWRDDSILRCGKSNQNIIFCF